MFVIARKVGGQVIHLNLDNVNYIEDRQDGARVIFHDGATILLKDTYAELLEAKKQALQAIVGR